MFEVQEKKDQRKDHHQEFTIVVNGRRKTVREQVLSYSQIVGLAFENPPTDPNVIFTVTYKNAAGPQSEGILVEGESVKIKNGTIFNVRSTNKS